MTEKVYQVAQPPFIPSGPAEVLRARTTIIDGYSYEVVLTKGELEDPCYTQEKLNPNSVYLNIGVIDEVNGITHDYQVFNLSRYCESVKGN
jgi:hypothetical protein